MKKHGILTLYGKCPLCFLSIPVACMLLILVPGADSEIKTTNGAYGRTANYMDYLSIDYPQFSLRFIEKKALDQNSPETPVTYAFQIVHDAKSQQIEWHDTDYRIHSYETFRVGNQTYFIDLKRSDFTGERLANGELIVWTLPQYQQFKHRMAQTKREALQKLSLLNREHERQHAKRETEKSLLAIYRGYLQALNMPEETDEIIGYLSDQNPFSQAGQIQRLFSRPNPELDLLRFHNAVISSEDAKLYLSATSAQKDRLIGVRFIRQQGEWKIADEKIVPDNRDGRAWIKRFMQPGQNS